MPNCTSKPTRAALQAHLQEFRPARDP